MGSTSSAICLRRSHSSRSCERARLRSESRRSISRQETIGGSSSSRPLDLMRVALIALILSAAPLGAQTAIAGFVRDSAGRPIPDAQVAVETLGRETSADASGHFVLNGL